MDKIRVSDITMKQLARQGDNSLSFKGKIEVSKLLDRLAVPVIEIEGIRSARADALRVKSVASAVKDSVVAVPVELNEESVSQTWEALKGAKHPRLQVMAPVSTVQMEYLSRKSRTPCSRVSERSFGPAQRRPRTWSSSPRTPPAATAPF